MMVEGVGAVIEWGKAGRGGGARQFGGEGDGGARQTRWGGLGYCFWFSFWPVPLRMT